MISGFSPVSRIDLEVPVICLAVGKGSFPIDGWNRILEAIGKGLATLPCVRLNEAEQGPDQDGVRTAARPPSSLFQMELMMIAGNFVSADHIVETFREDHEVLKVSSRWPDTAFERIEILHRARRPVGNILRYPWRHYTLDRNELLAFVYPFWPKPGFGNHSWTLKEMTDAMQLGAFPCRRESNQPGSGHEGQFSQAI